MFGIDLIKDCIEVRIIGVVLKNGENDGNSGKYILINFYYI